MWLLSLHCISKQNLARLGALVHVTRLVLSATPCSLLLPSQTESLLITDRKPLDKMYVTALGLYKLGADLACYPLASRGRMGGLEVVCSMQEESPAASPVILQGNSNMSPVVLKSLVSLLLLLPEMFSHCCIATESPLLLYFS